MREALELLRLSIRLKSVTRLIATVALLALGALLAACGGAKDLQLQVEAPHQAVVGQSVDLRLIVRNSSGSVMNLSGGIPSEAYEFYVYDGTGHEVWRSLHAYAALSGVLANWTIAPHDQVSHEVSWSGVGDDGQPLPPGDYTVTGKIFLSDNNSPESPPAAITLLAPQP
jgi:hypothetical protein